MEEVAVSDSLGVVAVCESLAQAAESMSERPIVARLEERTQLGPLIEGADSLRDMTGANQTIVLYVGNLESYQGIDLLLDGFAKAVARVSDLSLIIIGGSDQDLRQYRQRASVLGIESDVFFLGPRPIEHLRAYLEQADVLISPRINGTNTPMKIYSFLDAGVALLATRCPSHVQVLDDEIACLFDPDPVSLANAVVGLHESPDRRERLGQAATARVAELYKRTGVRREGAPHPRADRGASRNVNRLTRIRRAGASLVPDTTRRCVANPHPAQLQARIRVPFSPE